jgi:glycosyltransferase involved in cell wall biosynthesis
VEKVIAETVRRCPEYEWTLYSLRYARENVEKVFPQMGKVVIVNVPEVMAPEWLPSKYRRPETNSLLELWSYRRFLTSHPIKEDLMIAHLSFATVVSLYTKVPAVWYCHCATRYLYEGWIQKEVEDLIGRTPVWAKWLRKYLRDAEISCAKRFAKVLCNSWHTQKKLKEYFDISATIIYPGVELPPAFTPAYGNYFLLPARLNYYKRADVAIRAMAYLKDIPALRLKIVGKGMAEQSLRALMRDLELTSVDFEDFVADLSEEYRKALGVIYMSKDEDFGIVPVEAMAYQKPIIAADEGGMRETVVDGETGFLVQPEPAVVAGKMRQLFFDRNMALEMGKAGRARASMFSWDRHVTQLKNYIRDFV